MDSEALSYFIRRLDGYEIDSELDLECSLSVAMRNEELKNINLAKRNMIYERRLPTCIRSIYSADEGHFFWVYSDWHRQPFSVFRCDEAFLNVEMMYFGTDIEVNSIFNMLGEIFPCYAIGFGGIVLHSTLMSYRGHGILLAAPSGTGKSTHAHLWRNAGLADIINGDMALCKKSGEQWMAHGIPWCGSSNECSNQSLPLAMIVILEQYSENIAVRLKPSDALAGVLNNVLVPYRNQKLIEKLLDLVVDIIAGLPVLLLRCRPDVDAVMTLKQEMDRLLDGGGKQ